MFRIFTFAISWKSSDVRCEVVPLPCVALVTLPGILCRIIDHSAMLDAVTLLGLTSNALGTCAVTTMGSNLVGSKPSFG